MNSFELLCVWQGKGKSTPRRTASSTEVTVPPLVVRLPILARPLGNAQTPSLIIRAVQYKLVRNVLSNDFVQDIDFASTSAV